MRSCACLDGRASLESIAIIDGKVKVPMRDSKCLQANIYCPRNQSKKYPLIFVRTPYNLDELGHPNSVHHVT
jgi:predicted acyl esterase